MTHVRVVVALLHVFKQQLISLCEAAVSTNIDIEVDPDGLREDNGSFLRSKLTTYEGILKLPFLCGTTNHLTILPRVSMLDFRIK